MFVTVSLTASLTATDWLAVNVLLWFASTRFETPAMVSVGFVSPADWLMVRKAPVAIVALPHARPLPLAAILWTTSVNVVAFVRLLVASAPQYREPPASAFMSHDTHPPLNEVDV